MKEIVSSSPYLVLTSAGGIPLAITGLVTIIFTHCSNQRFRVSCFRHRDHLLHTYQFSENYRGIFLSMIGYMARTFTVPTGTVRLCIPEDGQWEPFSKRGKFLYRPRT
ncbi:MAG: hypothetical protein M2R45_02471 [Verrucomicrobia subdivision 3 bacterium]|nr:hypothetical protein [Limisphaerales bacterium]MCS1413259.1 hypothetical protein [Limisphaerales bacterium]